MPYLPQLDFTDAYFEAVSGLTASGPDFPSSVSAVIASLNNTRPGLTKVGPATTYPRSRHSRLGCARRPLCWDG